MWIKVRKKPVEVKAFQFDEEMWNLIKTEGEYGYTLNGVAFGWDGTTVLVNTLEGTHEVTVGDWIIKGVQGEYYPCKPDIFEMTYDFVE